MISSMISPKEKKQLKRQAYLRKMNTPFPKVNSSQSENKNQEELQQQQQSPLTVNIRTFPSFRTKLSKTSNKQQTGNSNHFMSTKNTLFTTLSEENNPDMIISSHAHTKSPEKSSNIESTINSKKHNNINLTDIHRSFTNSSNVDIATRKEFYNTIRTHFFVPIKREYKMKSKNENQIQKKVNNLSNNVSTLNDQLEQSHFTSRTYSIQSRRIAFDMEKTLLENQYLNDEIEKTTKQIQQLREDINKYQKSKILNENEYENAVNEIDELKSSVKKMKVNIDEINSDIKNMKSARFLILKKIDEVNIKLKQKGKTNQLNSQINGLLKTIIK